MAQFTKAAIMTSFVELLNERPFDKISVVDIAEKCGINRNTFYYYYTDVYALVDEIFGVETQKVIELNPASDTWQEAFMQATDFARKNRHAIYHLYNSAARDRLEDYLYDEMLVVVDAFVEKQAQGLNVDPTDKHDLAEFYTAAMVGLVTKWLRGGMKEDADAYIASMGRLLDGNIRFTFERRSV
jgi:probable dihydroxyacetone kinase regulator